VLSLKKSTMKKYLIILIFCSLATPSFSQNRETREMLSEIEGEWKLDNNDNLTYERIISVDNLSKMKLYERALNYIIYNYNDANSTIQDRDKERGTIVAKGMYGEINNGFSLLPTAINTIHILRIDVKEGRAKILLTLTEYDQTVSGGGSAPTQGFYKISSQYPVNSDGYMKNNFGRAFADSHRRALLTLSLIEKALNEGNTTQGGDDW
jgi:hypothetical protein